MSKRMYLYVGGIVAVCLIAACAIFLWMSKKPVMPKADDTPVIGQEVAEAKEPKEEKEPVVEVKDTFVAPAEYEAVITVTINPTIRIYVGKDGEVLAVEPVNADAKAVVAVMEEVTLESMNFEACMDLLVTTACDLNYLTDGEDIVVTVDAEDEEVTKKMMEEVQQCVETVTENRQIAVALEVKEASKKEVSEAVDKTQTAEAVRKPVKNDAPAKVEEPKKPVKEEKPSSDKDDHDEKPQAKPEVKPEYKLVWEDNFNGTELNRDDWNVELHAPGWVNAEWQEYVDSTDNIYVKDGNLVIQAIKSGEGEDAYYTSGRVNTQNKHDFKYGRFEAKIKVPSGMGFLPAFWMMPTDENFYGQWPKCGEIDIMEVMGQSTNTLHGTIHYGEPHTQKQGTYVATNNDFSKEFHVFACEWEPGEIRWYVDGKLYHTANDWFSQKPGFDEVAYPAPFDQPFYMILNLAVGGSWVGYPDETTQFGDNAQLVVDYVKVYQKDSYNENVVKPEQAPIVFKEPDATGNYVVNGNFATAEDLSDSTDWGFMLAQGGEATATISDGELHIAMTKAGTVDYSVQVVQPNMSMMLGKRYRLSFDAYADAERTMITGVTAPDYNYVRYLADTKLNLTTTKQSYAYEFDMTVRDDANGRVEFNLGNQGSTATVHITNVRLEVIGDCEVPTDEKSVLPDGNYVYNGDFSYGADRMKYWTVPSSNMAGSKAVVTNDGGVRELKVSVPSSVSDLAQVVVEQKDVALNAGTKYILSFDAHADKAKAFKVAVAGCEFTCDVTTENKEYTYSFVAGEGNDYVLKLLLGVAGTTYIDNVRIQEDGMLVNGGFSNGLVGYETYYDASATASFSVDELNEGGAACIDIKDTGDADWKVQLKQNNVTLEEAKWYRISFKAKSVTALGSAGTAYNRDIMCALQRNGAVHKNADGSEDWTPYVQKTVSLTGEYQDFAFDFQMMPATAPKTDEGTILTFSMGAVGGKRITDSHIVVIDDVVLEEIEAPKQEEVVAGTELIDNGSFVNDAEDWVIDITEAANAEVTCTEGEVTFNIANPGTEDWNVKLHQDGKRLEHGATYEVTFSITSSVDRIVKWGLMTSTWNWYTGEDMELTAGETYEVNHTYTVAGDDKPTTNDISFYVSMGKNAGEDTPAGQITITTVSVKKVSGGDVTPPSEDDADDTEGDEGGEGGTTVEPLPAGTELIKNGNFANNGEGWSAGINAPAIASATYADGKAILAIENAGEANWHLQLFQNNIALETGAAYKVTFTITSSVARSAKYAILDPSNDYKWYGGEAFELEAGVPKEISYVTGPAEVATMTGQFQMTFAPDGDSTNVPTDAHTIEISNVSVVKQ